MSNFDASGLQRQLITRGFLDAVDASGKSNIDGVFGTVTQSALVKYQESVPLPPTGQPDDATMLSLGMAVKPPAVVKWALPTFSIPAIASDYILNFLTSKINIWAAAMAAIIIAFVNTRFGLNLGAGAIAWVTTVLLGIMTGGIWVLRTFFLKPKVVAGKVALKAEEV